MRQICLVARDLDAVQADLAAVFGLEVCYRDPGVGHFGLHNFLMPVGNNFLEVVAPTREDTAAGRYLERRGGDGGYMVITQVDDVDAARARVTGMGIRLVNDGGRGEDRGIQLHPRDVPGAIVELRQNSGADDPAGPWSPAGPDWQRAKRTGTVTAMAAAEIQADDPPALAAHWGAVLDRPVAPAPDGMPSIALDDATLRFVPIRDARGEGLGGLDLATPDPARVLQAAQSRGCPVDGNTVMVCGIRFRLV
jgi:hypothetical protein